MKKIWKIAALLLALVMMVGMLTGCGNGNKDQGGGESGDGKVDVHIVIVDKDEKEYPYDIHVTAGSTLREALFEAELISEETFYAMFVEDIDGHVADVLNDGCTWLPCDADGNQLDPPNFDEITMKGGETIKLVYYVVPDMD